MKKYIDIFWKLIKRFDNHLLVHQRLLTYNYCKLHKNLMNFDQL
jgi:hypothetical protein